MDAETGSEVLTPDLCVIGAGSAGLSVAAIAASFGVPVVLIEKDRMGGDCLNVGCVPSKALIAAADRAHAIRSAGRFGDRARRARRSITLASATTSATSSPAIAPNDSVERFTALGVQVIRAEARFTDAAPSMPAAQTIAGASLRRRHRLASGRAADPGPRRTCLT